MSKFADKDTSYKDKVVYAKEATKTAITIYGGYKVGKGIQSLTDNLNIVTK